MVLFYPEVGESGVHTFPESICAKLNVIAQLELELVYYDSVVQRFNHYTTAPLVQDKAPACKTNLLSAIRGSWKQHDGKYCFS